MNVLTMGTFDLLHAGHLELFQYGSRLGNLMIGINSDRFIQEYKGKLPAQDLTARRLNIIRFYHSAEIWLNDGPGKDLIEKTKPDVILVGMDWHAKDYLKQIGIDEAFLNDNNIILAYAPRTTGVSSSAILEAIDG